jgi:hypothetical protein
MEPTTVWACAKDAARSINRANDAKSTRLAARFNLWSGDQFSALIVVEFSQRHQLGA